MNNKRLARVSLGRNHIPIFRDVVYALHLVMYGEVAACMRALHNDLTGASGL